MDIQTLSFSIHTNGKTDLINITSNVQSIISDSGFIEGNALVFAPGSTAGITTIEYEPGLLQDYPIFFEKIIPSNITYFHDETWHDGNGHSHVRASLQGSSFTIPFSGRKLLTGTWQQIVFVDFDNRARRREVIVQIIGKK